MNKVCEVLIGIASILFVICYLLPFSYRYFSYQFYYSFPKHPHFYQHKSYFYRFPSYALGGLFVLYLVIAVFFIHQKIVPFSGLKQIYAIPLGFCFVLLTGLDLKFRLIPFTPLWCLLFMGMSYQSQLLDLSLVWWIEKGFMLGGVWVIYPLFQRGIGLGDMFLISALIPFFSMMIFLYLILLACLLGLLFVAMLRLRVGQSTSIAFAPCLAISAWLMFLVSA